MCLLFQSSFILSASWAFLHTEENLKRYAGIYEPGDGHTWSAKSPGKAFVEQKSCLYSGLQPFTQKAPNLSFPSPANAVHAGAMHANEASRGGRAVPRQVSSAKNLHCSTSGIARSIGTWGP